jgi:ribA/ribD-fused uncharacterized protein
MIDKFDGENKFLSNFHMCIVWYEGIPYPTIEHAYQAAKTFDLNQRKYIAGIPWNKAGQAKRIGKRIPLRNNWEEIKLSVMEDLLRQKFGVRPNFKQKLLDTGNEELIEGNYWHDNYWGNCKCKKCIDKPGLNMLGKLLMKIRSDL